MQERQLNTEMLLTLMAKLEMILQAAKGKRIASSDPRYDAVIIKSKDLLNKFQKLIPAVMLSEIANLDKLIKELYQIFGEEEEAEETKGRIISGRDN